MTFSEFGRQTAANGSIGTDHGDSAPLFLFGDCINHGFYGPNPEIPDVITPQAGTPMLIDFRDIYASILKDWFLVEEEDVRSLFEHEVIFHNVIGNCSLNTEEIAQAEKVKAIAYPNPCQSKTTLKLEASGEYVSIFIVNLQGQHIKTVYEGTLSPTTHHIPIDMSDVKQGNYHIIITRPTGKENVAIIKM